MRVASTVRAAQAGDGAIAEVSIDNIRADYSLLDRIPVPPLRGRLLSLESIDPRPGLPEVHTLRLPPRIQAFVRVKAVQDALLAARCLSQAGRDDVLILDAATEAAKYACFLNSFVRRPRRILVWNAFVQSASPRKRWAIARAMQGCTLAAVMSRAQVRLQADYLGLPQEKFIYLPFKANHSQRPPIELKIGNYVFSGGNSSRDYRTLFDAVRETEIPVLVSATDPAITAGLEVPPNVILLAAREPHFARLTAASRFVAIPLAAQQVRGAGEANICNAMWHGRAVVCADDLSASDYIEDGVQGFVVPAGDAAALRGRILELWNDPARCDAMGRRGHERVAGHFTHEHFIRRLITLAALLGCRA